MMAIQKAILNRGGIQIDSNDYFSEVVITYFGKVYNLNIILNKSKWELKDEDGDTWDNIAVGNVTHKTNYISILAKALNIIKEIKESEEK